MHCDLRDICNTLVKISIKRYIQDGQKTLLLLFYYEEFKKSFYFLKHSIMFGILPIEKRLTETNNRDLPISSLLQI